ncbi:MAG: DUF3164 family protein [Oceanospirillaceae bacterium]|nr:DUF3164 family protein [Oceanospirillaceae bacterium]
MNSRGHMVPEDQVREQDKLRNQVVMDLVKEALLLNQNLKDFKRRALNDIADLVSIAAQKYEVQIGGKKGNVNLISYNGQYKIVRSVADRISFTEELEAAKELITECINDWTQGSSNNVRALVDRAFKTNAQGQVKTAAVLDLIRLEIDDEKWKRAMDALKDSIQVKNTATYIRIYERVGMTDQYVAVPLDIAAVRA